MHPYEIGGIYNKKGQALLIKDGNNPAITGDKRHFVTFTRDEQKLMAGNIMTHNHPGGSAFSDADIHFLWLHRGAEIRALAPDRTYRMINKYKYSQASDTAHYMDWTKFKASITRYMNRAIADTSRKYHQGVYANQDEWLTEMTEQAWREWTTKSRWGRNFEFIIEYL